MIALQFPWDDTVAHLGHVSLRDRRKHRISGATRRIVTRRAQHLGLRAVNPELSELLRTDEVAHADPLSAARGILLGLMIGGGAWAALIAVLS